MDVLDQKRTKGVVHQPMGCQPRQAVEAGRHHHYPIVPSPGLGPRVTGMVGTVVDDLDVVGGEAVDEGIANGLQTLSRFHLRTSRRLAS